MKKKLLQGNKYLFPSAAGVYHLACQPSQTSAKKLFSDILRRTHTRIITTHEVQRIMEINSHQRFTEEMQTILSLGWLEEHDTPFQLPDDALEELLPQLLTVLSSTGHTFLSDSHGFPLFSSGFPKKDVEALSAMSAQFSSIYDKYHAVIQRTAQSPTQAWGMIDAAGNSNMGIWPISIGNHGFNLLIQGIPKLDHPNFVILVWLLYSRYFEI